MLATILISALLAVLLGLAVWYQIKTFRSGGCVGCTECAHKKGKAASGGCCTGNCASCAMHCAGQTVKK